MKAVKVALLVLLFVVLACGAFTAGATFSSYVWPLPDPNVTQHMGDHP